MLRVGDLHLLALKFGLTPCPSTPAAFMFMFADAAVVTLFPSLARVGGWGLAPEVLLLRCVGTFRFS